MSCATSTTNSRPSGPESRVAKYSDQSGSSASRTCSMARRIASRTVGAGAITVSSGAASSSARISCTSRRARTVALGISPGIGSPAQANSTARTTHCMASAASPTLIASPRSLLQAASTRSATARSAGPGWTPASSRPADRAGRTRAGPSSSCRRRLAIRELTRAAPLSFRAADHAAPSAGTGWCGPLQRRVPLSTCCRPHGSPARSNSGARRPR